MILKFRFLCPFERSNPYKEDYNKFNAEYVANKEAELKEELDEGKISHNTYIDKVSLTKEIGYGEYQYLKDYVDSKVADEYEINVKHADMCVELGAVCDAGTIGLGAIVTLAENEEEKKKQQSAAEKQ